MVDSTGGATEAAPLLPADARFTGLLAFRGEARIEGDLAGEVLADGRLTLGERAVARATIEAGELVVRGTFEGTAEADRIELAPTARVSGELRTARLVVAAGSRLDGRCETASGRAAPARRNP